MVTKQVFIVFVLPVILSIIVGSTVLFDILQKPDRELNMWPMSHSEGNIIDSKESIPHSEENIPHSALIGIIGLSKQYTTQEPIEIQVKIDDPSFSCGDLYITIYSSKTGNPVAQGGFFEQCFESGNKIIPVGDKFSEIITSPGTYEIVVEMLSKQLKNLSTKATFTIK